MTIALPTPPAPLAVATDQLPAHVYVHVPFCRRRCSYCNFAIAVRPNIPVGAYIDGVRRELQIRYPVGGAAARARTLYLGGGTPSLLGANGVARLTEVLTGHGIVGDDTEITLETNPEDVTAEAGHAWLRAGINRVSIGVQSFDGAVLAWMHRLHPPERAGQAVDTLRSVGFRNLSVDLIFALPASLGRVWAADLAATLALGVDHISLYGLTVEPHTPLARWVARGRAAEATEDTYESDYLLAHTTLADAGYEHYEVSNFARPGYRSRHNSAYWVGTPYLGLGPAAHGFDGRLRQWNESRYTHWLDRVGRGVDPLDGAEDLTPENRMLERVYLELRTAGGTVLVEREQRLANPWIAAGWGHLESGRLTLSPTGWLRLDTIALELANARSR